MKIGKGVDKDSKIFVKKQLDYKHTIKGKAMPESKIDKFVVIEAGI